MHPHLHGWRASGPHRQRAAAAAVTAALLILAVLATAGCASPAGEPAFVRPAGHVQAASGGPHAVTIGAEGRTSATLAVLTGVSLLTVTAAAMPGQLLRVSTPANSQLRPELTETAGQVQLSLASTGQPGPAVVSVEVNSAVAWRFELSGGATQTSLDLAAGKVAGLDITAGISLIRLSLPRPDHTVTITLAGGATLVELTAPPGVPDRLELAGGASLVTLGGVTYHGVAGGTVLTSPGWSRAASRYDIIAPAGISRFSATVAG